MRGEVSSFKLPKAGNSESEFEDAHSVGPAAVDEGEIAVPRVRLALADGASESMFAGRWAAELTRCFAKDDRRDAADLLAEATGLWSRLMDGHRQARQAAGRPIQWFEEPGLTRGAHATLLLVELDGTDGEARAGDWTALAFGDTCLFQVRDEQLLVTFPIEGSAAFNSVPALVPSRLTDPRLVTSRLLQRRGTWCSGDYMYLATDALAAWLLEQHEHGKRPWTLLRKLGTPEAGTTFPDWIENLRREGDMRNDDVTLVRFAIW